MNISEKLINNPSVLYVNGNEKVRFMKVAINNHLQAVYMNIAYGKYGFEGNSSEFVGFIIDNAEFIATTEKVNFLIPAEEKCRVVLLIGLRQSAMRFVESQIKEMLGSNPQEIVDTKVMHECEEEAKKCFTENKPLLQKHSYLYEDQCSDDWVIDMLSQTPNWMEDAAKDVLLYPHIEETIRQQMAEYEYTKKVLTDMYANSI